MTFPGLALLLALLAAVSPALAAEPFLRSGDIVALVGGEEMVATAEAGELELVLTSAAPDLHLGFRSVAREGDTVYEQRRDLNYPALEDQLGKIGATVLMLDFGQMECLDGAGKVPDFIAAYEKLLDRLAGDGHRRVLLFLPHHFTRPETSTIPDLTDRNDDVDAYAAAIRKLAERRGATVAEWSFSEESAVTSLTRDGIHLNAWGEALRALGLSSKIAPNAVPGLAPAKRTAAGQQLLKLIREKNRLWFNYYRPQNWAFLAGDRTNQPSSRDHLDPNHRWFPEEMEQYVPLIEAKDREIWEAARKLAATTPRK